MAAVDHDAAAVTDAPMPAAAVGAASASIDAPKMLALLLLLLFVMQMQHSHHSAEIIHKGKKFVVAQWKMEKRAADKEAKRLQLECLKHVP